MWQSQMEIKYYSAPWPLGGMYGPAVLWTDSPPLHMANWAIQTQHNHRNHNITNTEGSHYQNSFIQDFELGGGGNKMVAGYDK